MFGFSPVATALLSTFHGSEKECYQMYVENNKTGRLGPISSNGYFITPVSTSTPTPTPTTTRPSYIPVSDPVSVTENRKYNEGLRKDLMDTLGLIPAEDPVYPDGTPVNHTGHENLRQFYLEAQGLPSLETSVSNLKRVIEAEARKGSDVRLSDIQLRYGKEGFQVVLRRGKEEYSVRMEEGAFSKFLKYSIWGEMVPPLRHLMQMAQNPGVSQGLMDTLMKSLWEGVVQTHGFDDRSRTPKEVKLHFRTSEVDGKKIRALSGITADTFPEVNCVEVLELVCDQLNTSFRNAGFQPPGAKLRYDRSNSRVTVDLPIVANPDNSRVASHLSAGSPFSFGLRVSVGDIGNGPIRIEFFAVVNRCLNLIILGEMNQKDPLKIVHRGSREAILSKVRVDGAQVVKQFAAAVSKFAADFGILAKTDLQVSVSEALDSIAEEKKWDRLLLEAALVRERQLVGTGGLSDEGSAALLMNTITRAAQLMPSDVPRSINPTGQSVSPFTESSRELMTSATGVRSLMKPFLPPKLGLAVL